MHRNAYNVCIALPLNQWMLGLLWEMTCMHQLEYTVNDALNGQLHAWVRQPTATCAGHEHARWNGTHYCCMWMSAGHSQQARWDNGVHADKYREVRNLVGPYNTPSAFF